MGKVICGDALEKLRGLATGCARTCITSTPYYGLRDYGTGVWKGGDLDCNHKPGSESRVGKSGLQGGTKSAGHKQEGFRAVCGKCGAIRIDKQIGLEPTPEEFIAKLVDVFHEVKRVLTDDGTLWVNIGDSYAGGNGNGGVGPLSKKQTTNHGSYHGTKMGMGDAKPKDLLGIPWMLAFALRADGWYLRNEIIWAKPNPMPESILDRCTKSHEQIFLLSKSPQYYFDADAIKEPSVTGDGKPGGDRTARNSFKRGYSSRPANIVPGNDYNPHRPDRANDDWNIAYRNKRDVWTVSTKPYDGAHFATFPRDLIVPCILAGSAPGDTVLDPFGGAGTTAKTAQELGRDYITIELNQKYIDEIILPRLAATNIPLPGIVYQEESPKEKQETLL